ncbi:hypothetical protein HO173_005039 [Letharia columbiana]|uniref:F-box domain-containing protein n=1 Tax=Letharia columbiana TaxID=112416 RepID=A0A8H6FXT8_9LECA|nr:uncharacterized protein HO173_005039 [Letharia columbiana]KAF6236748.1 hypothetical protein HO173_005039 [Letharia columbiana]
MLGDGEMYNDAGWPFPFISHLHGQNSILLRRKPIHVQQLAIMTRFLDLPEELILGVITFIPLEDLENFAQTCPRIHSVAGSALEKHWLLIRHYSTLENEGAVRSRRYSKRYSSILRWAGTSGTSALATQEATRGTSTPNTVQKTLSFLS